VLGGWFWFKFALADCEAGNVTQGANWHYPKSNPEFSRGKSKTFQPFNRAFSALYNALQLRS